MMLRHLLYLIPFLLSAYLPVLSQEIEVTLGPDEIAENQLWPITITVHNGELKSYDKFPDIPGFRKRDESHRSSTSFVNGKISSSQSRMMYYSADAKGVINVPSFIITVNNKKIQVKGKKVTVKALSRQQQQQPSNPNRPRMVPDDFFGDEPTEYIEIPDDAFLAVTTDKNEVYVGEGVTATLAFYRAETNRAILQFYEISRQLTEILKKLKPTNCWEENFNIEDIEGERVTVNGKDYIRFKIYQAVFYPFNSQPIKFPSVSLEMLKYKVARRPSFFSPNTMEAFKTFKTEPKTVIVKDLPPHPLKNSVAVGEFRLSERLGSKTITTGQSTAYEFSISGEGNIASMPNPVTKSDDVLEIYAPTVQQEISKSNNKITGTKSFRYFMIPKEPGQYKLADYFQFVFFSPAKKKYDTLYSKNIVMISGESKKNESIDAYDPGNFYDKAGLADNTLRIAANTNWSKWLFNGLIITLLGTSVVLLFKKP